MRYERDKPVVHLARCLDTHRVTLSADDVLAWLVTNGITKDSEGRWIEVVDGESVVLTTFDVASSHTPLAMQGGTVELAVGLLALLDAYWAAAQIYMEVVNDEQPDRRTAVVSEYRVLLERPADPGAARYSLRVDWFEDRRFSAFAFDAVAGADIATYSAQGRSAALGLPPLSRRLQRVLEDSGPVPWEAKAPAYSVAAEVPALRNAVFAGILHSYHDICGDLAPPAVLELLDRLHLAPDHERLQPLRAVLSAGHRNHYRSPSAWKDEN